MPETQQRITAVVYSACSDVGRALGREDLKYSELIQLAVQWLGSQGIPLPFLLKTTVAGDILAPVANAINTNFHEQLSQLDTEEKFETFLATTSEPDPQSLEMLLGLIENALVAVRSQVSQNLKRFPHSQGGRREKLASIEQQKQIIDEIKRRRNPRTTLKRIFEELAQENEVSASKIKQIWTAMGKERG